LVRFGYRDYDPEAGRWSARDPIGFNGGDSNLYGYVSHNPGLAIDLIGLAEKTDILVFDNPTGCAFVSECVRTWDDYPSSPGLMDQPPKKPKGVKNVTWFLATEVGVEMAKGAICAEANRDQCGGNYEYAPWRNGMDLNTRMSDIDCVPDDAYFDPDRSGPGLGAWVDSEDSCKRDTHFLELGWVSCELAPYKLGKLRSPLRSRAFE
jgi:hypothetical protein